MRNDAHSPLPINFQCLTDVRRLGLLSGERQHFLKLREHIEEQIPKHFLGQNQWWKSISEKKGCTRTKATCSIHPKCPAAANTSCTMGVTPSTPTEALPSNSDEAKTRAAAQLKSALPWARPGRGGAATEQIGHVLSLHPRKAGDELGCFCGETPSPSPSLPTSPANTTSLAMPPRLGKSASLFRRVCSRSDARLTHEHRLLCRNS